MAAPPQRNFQHSSYDNERLYFEGRMEPEPENTWWNSAKNLMGGVVSTAGSMAWKAGETVSNMGIIENIKAGASTVY